QGSPALWAIILWHFGAIRAWFCVLISAASALAEPNLRDYRELEMNMQTKMQDVVGLTKVAPLSRRGFMTASAASAAGYTLAAGPVRADPIKTDTTGLTAGDAKVAAALADMPVYYTTP